MSCFIFLFTLDKILFFLKETLNLLNNVYILYTNGKFSVSKCIHIGSLTSVDDDDSEHINF